MTARTIGKAGLGVLFVVGLFIAASGWRGALAAPQGGEWLKMDPLPRARAFHSAVWTGKYMIIWGGETDREGNDNCVSDGGLYMPEENRWVAITGIHAPAGRIYHSCHWTDLGMFVWGGVNKYKVKGKSVWVTHADGAIYNPASNEWRGVAAGEEAPAGRRYHCSATTGKEVIVWSGQGEEKKLLDDGAVYVLKSETWRKMSSDGAPPPRIEGTAVWTGKYVVIWGGRGEKAGKTAFLNSGALYDPAKDTWKPVSSTGAPSPRGGHTAIWTGNRMVIWGGVALGPRGKKYLNDGGVYNPSTDRWISITTEGAPIARYYHTAVWTGHQMIVWGGRIEKPSQNGGVYWPERDEWKFVTTLNGPASRYGHTSVWTGDRMVIWGGKTTSQKVCINDMGAYIPPK